MTPYFSSRYDLDDPRWKDVITIDFLLTGMVMGFTLYIVAQLLENNPELDPKIFSEKLLKWVGIKITTKKQLYDALEDILGWDEEHSIEVCQYGLENLFLFSPKNFERWNYSFEKAKWN